jgi:hypothetical protein
MTVDERSLGAELAAIEAAHQARMDAMTPGQRAIYQRVLYLGAQDGSDLRDVLDGMDYPVEDKVAVDRAMAGDESDYVPGQGSGWLSYTSVQTWVEDLFPVADEVELAAAEERLDEAVAADELDGDEDDAGL